METDREIAAFLGRQGATEQDLAAYLSERGWGVESPATFRIDLEQEFREIWKRAAPYTMISPERGYAVYQGVDYLLRRDLPGELVECGVWKGGTCMLMALLLLKRGVRDRTIRLYDTFSGMTEPGPEDRIASSGQAVSERWTPGWWAVGQEEVRKNLEETGYPAENILTVAGDVCLTLEESRPEEIALLRLDTDWYESTRAELEALYPLLQSEGVLIIDDYGHFSGARRAAEEFFHGLKKPPLLQRSDYTGRIALKPVP